MSESTHEWWQSAVVYEIYIRSFKDTNGDGVGDLDGITEKIDYLSETLGVDALWVTPFYPSPMADFGYDVSDYRAVHPLFGDLAAFDRLVARAHEAGLRIIVDFVPNHTSYKHPWFTESRSARETARRDWYVWRDPRPDGSPPNNWLSVFGGSAWEWDENTGQYYLHSFLKEQPDLNWRNSALKSAMYDNMRFWLDRDVDGFRLDAVMFMMKDPEERDNPSNEDQAALMHKSLGAYDAQLHHHDQGHPDIHGVFREMRAVLEEYNGPRIALGELHIYDPVRLVAFYGERMDELHMPANFGLLKVPWTAAGVRALVDNLEAALPDGAWANYVMGNHDDQRMASKRGEEESRQAAVLLLTLRGSPTLYYGDELGMREAEVTPNQIRDPWGIAEPHLTRDGCRTPMAWSPSQSAGFTSADEPWLPLSSDWADRNVASQLDDPDSYLSLYRRLLTLRKQSPALRMGTYRALDAGPEQCFVYERMHETERVLVAINFSSEPRSIDLADFHGRIAVSSDRPREGGTVAGSLALGAHEALILV